MATPWLRDGIGPETPLVRYCRLPWEQHGSMQRIGAVLGFRVRSGTGGTTGVISLALHFEKATVNASFTFVERDDQWWLAALAFEP